MDELHNELHGIKNEMTRMNTLIEQKFHVLDKIDRVLDGDGDTPGLIGKVQTLWRLKNWVVGLLTSLIITFLAWLLGWK